jgi:excisionase family DNA binding protein
VTSAERIAVSLEALVQHFCRTVPQAPLTAEQVAERLGVSVDKVYTMARKKQLRATKIGRAVRFNIQDVESFADQRPRLIA